MVTGKTALKEQALATLQAGRREISAEVQWIRKGLNPKKAVRRLARDHALAVGLTVLAVGIAVPLLLRRSFRKHRDRDEDKGGGPLRGAPPEAAGADLERPHRRRGRSRDLKPETGLGLVLLGLIVKAATPFLMREGLKIAERKAGEWLNQQSPRGGPAGPVSSSRRP
jgi:hypothetical protein